MFLRIFSGLIGSLLPALCSGQPTPLTASGATSYAWSTGETTASITVAPSASAVYSVTGTDGNGCTASAAAAISVTPSPILSFSQSVVNSSGNSVTI